MADREDYIEDDLFGDNLPDGDEGNDDAPKGDDKAEGAAAGDPNQADPSDPPKNGGENEGGEEGAPAEPGADLEGDDAKKEKPKDGFVPKAALESEKRRRRELTQRLAALEAKETAREQAAFQASMPLEGTPEHAAFVARQTQDVALNMNLNRSEYDVRKVAGDEKVDAMMDWAKGQFAKDPEWAKKVFAHAHPFDFALQEYEAREAAPAAANQDPDYAAFLEWKKSQGGEPANPAAAPSAATPQTPARAAPPRSITQRPSASGPSAPTDNRDAFDREFQ